MILHVWRIQRLINLEYSFFSKVPNWTLLPKYHKNVMKETVNSSFKILSFLIIFWGDNWQQ